MALITSTISDACQHVAKYLSDELGASSHPLDVTIGNPASVAPGSSDTRHCLNLFFYLIEPGGGQPAVLPGEPLYVRLRCLITAFGVTEESVSGGINELGILGEVIRILHEQPILASKTLDGEEVRMQVVLQPFGAEEVSQIWGTQVDTSYRPSVAYEIALIPIVPKETAKEAPYVGSLGIATRSGLDKLYEDFQGNHHLPLVPTTTVDTRPEDWAPKICLVFDSVCAEFLSFEIGAAALASFLPDAKVWVAGLKDSTVKLVWETWQQGGGWQTNSTKAGVVVLGGTIDPEDVTSASLEAFEFPFSDHAGQALLYAVRSYNRGSDGAVVEVRSNPVLVNLHEAEGA